MGISHILHKVSWCGYNLEVVLNIESFEREITLVAAPVTRDIQRRCPNLTGKKQKKDIRWTHFEENDGEYKGVRVSQTKASGLVFIHDKERE